MHPDLDVQRRVLVKSYRLYLDADRNWTIAIKEAQSWFPADRRSGAMLVGEPHSRMRQLYEKRERALQRMLLAREKLKNARRRLGHERQPDRVSTRIFLLGA
ncbi:hypothetical protein [Defluviimonas sp. SAOS-178_SWC]|uniref:hypothetical protein n=1 Tax=Defluviimonas sp. SAOS-178_SWC TaxID=3121287 RepID=UPI0032216198